MPIPDRPPTADPDDVIAETESMRLVATALRKLTDVGARRRVLDWARTPHLPTGGPTREAAS